MSTFRAIFATVFASLLLAACGGGSGIQSVAPPAPQSAFSTSSSRTVADEGYTIHILPPLHAGRALPVLSLPETGRTAQSLSGALQWHRGPVQHNPKLYVIFWGSKWSATNSVYKTTLNFFNGLKASRWNGTVTQYYDSKAHVANDIALAGAWIDTAAAVPLHPATGQVGAEAERGVSHFGFHGTDANYVVAIEQGHDPSGFASSWCAWHSDEYKTGVGEISFTNLPYMPDGGADCGSGAVNYPGINDGVSIVGGHEVAETETDPQPDSGWRDVNDNEVGDLCAWFDLQETSFSTGHFPTQPLYSDAAGACVQ